MTEQDDEAGRHAGLLQRATLGPILKMSEHLGKRKRKALKRAQKAGARVHRRQEDVAEGLVSAASSSALHLLYGNGKPH
jgi:hypothetical protein